VIGFGGTRVIVVDDDPAEALPIIGALSKKGISATFFDGNESGFPAREHRLSGVRLAILDMDLVGGGVPDKSKAAALVNTLSRILSPTNGPYAVLAWTRHPELLELFEQYVFSEHNVPNPILTVMIEKAECKNEKDEFSLDVISRRLESAVVEFSPALFLQVWEEKCFGAATDVTNQLSLLSGTEAEDLFQWRSQWKENMLQIIHAMSLAEAEKHLEKDTCLTSFYTALNPLHTDRMESNSERLSGTLSIHTGEVLGAPGDIGIERKAALNSMLHLAYENLDRLSAGNIYFFTEKTKPVWIPDVSGLIKDLIQGASGANGEKLNLLSNTFRLSIIEASPVCDHAQKNIRFARFVAGLLAPSDSRTKFKRNAAFVWEFGPIFLEAPVAENGQYFLYLSARHLVTTTIDLAGELKASVRLRSQAFTAFQAWLAGHASRPGVMLLS